MNLNVTENISIARSTIGTWADMADVCGCTYQNIQKWRKNNAMPRTEYTDKTRYSFKLEQATGGAVKVEDFLGYRPSFLPNLEQSIEGLSND